MKPAARRLADGPILHPGLDGRLGANINGPAAIEAPAWLPDRLARYYLYFSAHRGDCIWLAVADRPAGPWRVMTTPALTLGASLFPTEAPAELVRRHGPDQCYAHIASPDILIRSDRGEIWMYYHGLTETGEQRTRRAVSTDGRQFRAEQPTLGPAYMRLFDWDGDMYALAMPGQLLRSADGHVPFTSGPSLLPRRTRHNAVSRRKGTAPILDIVWSEVGDAPERLFHATLDLTPDWTRWRPTAPRELLRPSHPWEGAALPLTPSRYGAADTPVNQLRDPALLRTEDGLYLYYTVAGECGIAVAEVLAA